MSGFDTTNTPREMSAAERLAASVPGTEAHHATHGTGIATGTGIGTGAGTGTGAGMATRLKEAVPGTTEHAATHGMVGATAGQQVLAHIPGTEQHRIHSGMEGAGVGTGTGLGSHEAGLAGAGGHHGGGGMTGAVLTGAGLGGAGLGGAGLGAGHHHEGRNEPMMAAGTTGPLAGAHTGHEGVGHKIKSHIPGTREHEEKKIAEGKF